MHAPDGIRTRNPWKQATTNPFLRPHGGLDLWSDYEYIELNFRMSSQS
jgi:hypothetical protein